MRSELFKLGLVLLALFGAFSLLEEFKNRDTGLGLFLDAREVRYLCSSTGYPEGDFWERARIIGTAGALFRAEDLGQLIRRGRVHVNLHGRTSDDSLWVKDPVLTARVLAGLQARGFRVQAQKRLGSQVVMLPERLDPDSLAVEFDAEAAQRVAVLGLVPVFYLEEDLAPPSLSTATPLAVCLLSPRMRPQGDWIDLLRRGRFQPAFANAGDPFPGPWEARWSAIGRTSRGMRAAWADRGSALGALLAGEMELREGPAAVWREAFGRGSRMVLVHLDLGRGVEENFDELRRVTKPLRRAGYYFELPLQSLKRRFILNVEIWVRYVLALALSLFGPIVSVREGLRCLRFMRKRGHWPLASPVLEVTFGACAALGLAAAIGLAIHALLAMDAWRLGIFSGPWDGWVLILPLMIAAVSLYAAEAARWRVFWWRLSLALLTASALLYRLRTLEFWEAGSPIGWVLARAPSLWWIALRWREVFVGIPCLFVGLWLCSLHLDAGKEESVDPRPWLLLSLIPAISLIEVLARTQVPFELVLLQTLEGVGVGLLTGLIVLGARHWLVSWAFVKTEGP